MTARADDRRTRWFLARKTRYQYAAQRQRVSLQNPDMDAGRSTTIFQSHAETHQRTTSASRGKLKVFRRAILPLAMLSLAAPAMAEAPLPRLVAKGSRHALLVDGAAFLILGGQAHSSSTYPSVLPQVWPSIRTLERRPDRLWAEPRSTDASEGAPVQDALTFPTNSHQGRRKPTRGANGKWRGEQYETWSQFT